MISVTEKAKDRIASLRVEENRGTDQNIRVSVKGGGCSGLMYDLGLMTRSILPIRCLKTGV